MCTPPPEHILKNTSNDSRTIIENPTEETHVIRKHKKCTYQQYKTGVRSTLKVTLVWLEVKEVLNDLKDSGD